jgi:hypothetical protein
MADRVRRTGEGNSGDLPREEVKYARRDMAEKCASRIFVVARSFQLVNCVWVEHGEMWVEVGMSSMKSGKEGLHLTPSSNVRSFRAY